MAVLRKMQCHLKLSPFNQHKATRFLTNVSAKMQNVHTSFIRISFLLQLKHDLMFYGNV